MLSLWWAAVLQLCSLPALLTAKGIPEGQLLALLVWYPSALGYFSGSRLWDLGRDMLFALIFYVVYLFLAFSTFHMHV